MNIKQNPAHTPASAAAVAFILTLPAAVLLGSLEDAVGFDFAALITAAVVALCAYLDMRQKWSRYARRARQSVHSEDEV